MTNIFYILRRQVGSEAARELLSKLPWHIQVASIIDKIIRAALQISIMDFEDAVTNEAANATHIDITVTRNTADFVASLVPAVSIEVFPAMSLE